MSLILGLNDDMYRVIFSFLEIDFIQECMRLVHTSFNILIIEDETIQQQYLLKKVHKMSQDPDKTQSNVHYRTPLYNRYQMESFYSPYFRVEKDYHQALQRLKREFHRKMEETEEQRRSLASNRYLTKKDIYHHYEEIKSTINETHFELLREKISKEDNDGKPVLKLVCLNIVI